MWWDQGSGIRDSGLGTRDSDSGLRLRIRDRTPYTSPVTEANGAPLWTGSALRLSRVGISLGLQVAATSRSGVPLPKRLGQLLIGAEVALALVLVSGSGLLVRSFTRLVAVDMGFDPTRILTMEVEPLDQTAVVRNQCYPALTAALAAKPEVAAVGAIDRLALTGCGSYSFPKADTDTSIEGPQRTVLPGYFEAVGVRPLAGRLVVDADRAAGESPVVVNAATSAKYFSGAAADSIGPRVLVGRIHPGTDFVGEQVAKPRDRMILLTLLGSFGLLLTLVGIFSMTVYAVARRTREIGIRIAFGARPGDVVPHVVGDTGWPVLIGLAAGLGGAFYATRVIAAFLFETTPHDPATFLGVVALIAGAAGLAAWIPARRAAKVEPIIALRAE